MPHQETPSLDSEQDLASHKIVPADPEPLASSEGSVELDGGSTDLLDLSRQQRNLLLLRPIFQLERYKTMLGDEGSADRTLFHGIDTHYLALSALDLMMEATTVSSGSTSVEVVVHLGYIASRMKPGLTSSQARRIAEVVLDALDNKPGVAREIVTLNAGTALYSANVAASIGDGIQLAREAIASGKARAKVDELIRFTQQFKQ